MHSLHLVYLIEKCDCFITYLYKMYIMLVHNFCVLVNFPYLGMLLHMCFVFLIFLCVTDVMFLCMICVLHLLSILCFHAYVVCNLLYVS